MKRIEGQVKDSCELAKQVLSWITCAKRPLTTLELQHALAVEVGESALDEENLPEIKDMVSVCAGLVTVDEESNIIRLVHYTTQDFFEKTQKYWFPDAEKDVAMICVTYLSFDIFESGFCLSDEDFEVRLRSNPLYDYVAQNWGYHSREASGAQFSVPIFLENENKASSCSQAMMVSTEYRSEGYSQRMANQMIGVHLTAWFGLTQMTSILIENGHPSDYKDKNGRTPLSYAAENGHETVVELLLSQDNIDINLKDYMNQTPLSCAAKNGHETVIKLLLSRDNVDISSKNKNGRTALILAARKGHTEIVEVLLKNNADVNVEDVDGRTGLDWAAMWGHRNVEQLLRANGARAPKDFYGLQAMFQDEKA